MKKFVRRLAAIGGALLIPTVAFAYLSYPTTEGSVGGAAINAAGGSVLMWLNGSGQAIPLSAANPLPAVFSPGTYTSGSAATSVSATQVFPATSRVRVKLQNFDAAIDIWCRWGVVGSAPAAVNGIGSFKLAAGGGGIDDNGPGVNQSAVNCIAQSGTPNIYAEQY